MTIAAFARVTIHRLIRCQTWPDVQAIGNRLGIDRALPVASYLRELRRIARTLLALANTVLVVARRPFTAN